MDQPDKGGRKGSARAKVSLPIAKPPAKPTTEEPRKPESEEK